MNPQNPNELWAGAGEGNFAIDNYPGSVLYHTTDAGASWATISHAMGDLRALAVRPDAPSTLYAAANVGIFRSTNSGATWTQLSNGIPSGVGTEVLLDPSAPTTVYAALGRIFGDSGNGIYKSTDGGTTFTKLASGLPTTSVGRISLALAPSQTSTLYAAIQSTADYNLLGAYKSIDGGATWSTLSATPGFCSSQCWYDLEVAVDPANPDRVYLGGIDIYRSTDGGQDLLCGLRTGPWTRTTRAMSTRTSTPSSPRARASSGRVATAACPTPPTAAPPGPSGARASTRRSTTTSPCTRRRPDGPSAARRTTARTWPRGTTPSRGSTAATAGYCAISPADPNTMYEEYVYLDMNKSTDGGSNWGPATNGINTSDPVQFIAPFVMDPSNPNVLYAGTNRIYRTPTAPRAGPPSRAP